MSQNLRIIVTGQQFPDSFAKNIAVTLEQMGHSVTRISTTRAYHHQNRMLHAFWTYAPKILTSLERRAYARLVNTAALCQPDLILLTSGLPPEVLTALRRVCGAKITCWFTDHIANFYHAYIISGGYDALFLKEPSVVPVFREKLDLSIYYLPEACNPTWHTATVLSDSQRREFGCDLAAIGSLHYYRARMLEPFTAYDLKVWGNNCPSWIESATRCKYQRRYLAEMEKASAFRAAKIVINTMHYAEIDGVNCTLFEIAGSGGFQIADWKPTLSTLFEPDREIVTFQTRSELKEKIDYYLAHPSERALIAERSYERAQNDHTYEKRLHTILSVVGLLPLTEGTQPDRKNAGCAAHVIL